MRKGILLLLCLSASYLYAGDPSPVTFGIHFLAGGRYDDVRMCVGSPEGVKGGPIMDLYADIRFNLDDHQVLAVNIPVMRPILFAAAYHMLQFEPQMSYEYHLNPLAEGGLVLGGGLGAVFHYGPDYNSSQDNRGDSFFAMGPLFSVFSGYKFSQGEKGSWMTGLKGFYSPLFSQDYDNGTVAGGAVELHYLFDS